VLVRFRLIARRPLCSGPTAASIIAEPIPELGLFADYLSEKKHLFIIW
jgi:hypothetical protein